MPKLDSPLLISPVFKPKIWGRNNLDPIFQRPQSPEFYDALIGEVWITDDQSRFMNGPITGMTLAAAADKFGPELNGTNWKDRRFPPLPPPPIPHPQSLTFYFQKPDMRVRKRDKNVEQPPSAVLKQARAPAPHPWPPLT